MVFFVVQAQSTEQHTAQYTLCVPGALALNFDMRARAGHKAIFRGKTGGGTGAYILYIHVCM